MLTESGAPAIITTGDAPGFPSICHPRLRPIPLFVFRFSNFFQNGLELIGNRWNPSEIMVFVEWLNGNHAGRARLPVRLGSPRAPPPANPGVLWVDAARLANCAPFRFSITDLIISSKVIGIDWKSLETVKIDWKSRLLAVASGILPSGQNHGPAGGFRTFHCARKFNSLIRWAANPPQAPFRFLPKVIGIDWKSLEIIGNHWKRSESIGNRWLLAVASGIPA